MAVLETTLHELFWGSESNKFICRCGIAGACGGTLTVLENEIYAGGRVWSTPISGVQHPARNLCMLQRTEKLPSHFLGCIGQLLTTALTPKNLDTRADT